MDPEGVGMSNDSQTSKSMSASTPIVQARGLIKRYGRVVALDNADFDLLPGEILAVIGDNGAGKSSLIRALSGVDVLWQEFTVGCLIIVAVALDQWIRKVSA